MKNVLLSWILAVPLLLSGCGASLVFVSDRDGHDQIYSMAGSGFNQRNLSNNGSYEHFPDVSPDATKIVFSSFRNPPGENIYIMDRNGQNVQQVTTGSGQRITAEVGAERPHRLRIPRPHDGCAHMDDPERWQRAGRGDEPRPERVR